MSSWLLALLVYLWEMEKGTQAPKCASEQELRRVRDVSFHLKEETACRGRSIRWQQLQGGVLPTSRAWVLETQFRSIWCPRNGNIRVCIA